MRSNVYEFNMYDFHARQYDALFGRFHTMDPKAESFYSISPYVYCNNNPLRFIDPGGDSTRVYTETIDGGHTWISIGEGDDMIVYSFGPFDDDMQNTQISKGHKIKANGVLMKYTGKAAAAYVEVKSKTTDLQVYVVEDATDENVVKTIDDINSGSSVLKKYPVIDNSQGGITVGQIVKYNTNTSYGYYDAFSNNCTTFVCDVINKSGSKLLESTYTQPSGAILKVPMKTTTLRRYVLPSDFRSAINKK